MRFGLGLGYGLGLRNQLAFGGVKLTPSIISKFIAWYKPSEQREAYYINQIGVQERELLTDGGISGVVHTGRAIQYDGSKTQYSRTTGNMPNNFRLVNNSLTVSFNIFLSAAPVSTSLCVGTDSGSVNGSYYFLINTNGTITLVARAATAASVTSRYSVCDSIEHCIVGVIDKNGSLYLYVDNVLQGSKLDISTFSFSDYATIFYVGGSPTYSYGIKRIRNVRVFSRAITSEVELDSIYNDDYVNGCIAWYLCEENKEGSIYDIKNSIGLPNLKNVNFDSTSLVVGPWKSLLNKYGYSPVNYTGDDILLGDGNMTTPSLWTFTATRFEVANGVAYYKNVDTSGVALMNKRIVSIALGDVVKVSFDITEGSGQLFIGNQAQTAMNAVASYSVGHYDIIFKSLVAATGIRIVAVYGGGSFKLDNFTIKQYEQSVISPLITSQTPTLDTRNRPLVFAGTAKYNLQKLGGSFVSLQDNIGELFDACSLITVNDWYATDGTGNDLSESNISKYQTGRQYYHNGELIIINSKINLTTYEDNLLKRYIKASGETYTPIYTVDVAKGLTSGTTSEIYAMQSDIAIGGSGVLSKEITPLIENLDPTKKYIAMGWADFFNTDAQYTLPLVAKYNIHKFSNTFYRQIVPHSDDYRNTAKYDRNKLRMIEQSGSIDGQHGLFEHISFLSANPLCDGITTPSNNDLRANRGDGKNAHGNMLSDTVDTSITSVIRNSWLRLSDELGAKTWSSLLDSDCDAIRKSLAAFGMPFDAQNNQHVLQALDYLSNRYCGTTGFSVIDGDYTSNIPNTQDGLSISESNRIIGGIFQGSATTCNHEIWERVVLISKLYKIEFEGKIKQDSFWSSCGGNTNSLYYRLPGNDNDKFIDRDHRLLATGVSKLTSSITGQSRSLVDVLRSNGYVCSMTAQGDGYGYFSYDGQARLESQRIYKKNGCKKIDNLADGYTTSLRVWDSSIPIADQNTLLESEDLLKSLYDYVYSNPGGRYTGLNAYSSNFYHVINELEKLISWGLTPDFIGDSLVSGDRITSYLLVLEALFQYCVRAGITVISHEQAFLLSSIKITDEAYNYFPNPTFQTSPKTITTSNNAPSYPDGWNGGEASGGELRFTVGTFFTRQYSIKAGSASISFKSKGVGNVIIRKILNKDVFSNLSVGSVVATYDINSVDYVDISDSLLIPEAALESYASPTTPSELAYQNYMKGYGDKWCGIQIEVVVTGANELYIKEPIINITQPL